MMASAPTSSNSNVIFATELPKALETLVRKISRAFYEAEVVVIMDILLRDKCVREAEFMDILQLDARTVRCPNFVWLIPPRLIKRF